MNIIITDDDNKNQLFTGTSIDDAINYLKNIKILNKQKEDFNDYSKPLKELIKNFLCHYDVDTISIDKQTNSNYSIYIELYTTDETSIKKDSNFLEKSLKKCYENINYDLNIEDDDEDYNETKVIINIEELNLNLKDDFENFKYKIENIEEDSPKTFLHYSLKLPEKYYKNNYTREEIIFVLKENGFIIDEHTASILLETENDIFIGLNPYMWRFENLKKILIEKNKIDLEKEISDIEDKH